VFAEGKKAQTFITIGDAYKNRFSAKSYAEDSPEFTGKKILKDIPLQEVAEYIDWSPLFWTWDLKGSYPSILSNKRYGAQAEEIFRDAQVLLDQIIRENRFNLQSVIGVFTANSERDDVVIFDSSACTHEIERFCFLRQQRERSGLLNLCLADFIAPRDQKTPDHMGVFAVVCHGVDAFAGEFEQRGDDYQSIMVKALGDRFAEALAEYMHKQVRDLWGYGKQETLSKDDVIQERYRGIRPAPGYPACPDHTEKGKLWKLLGVEEAIGLKLTENFAMTPASSVSGFYFGHPESKYFNVGKIDRDQLIEYAKRKGMSISEAERWLAPLLN
jgi:5-methyltetrahydrofolate--homocysteine methyltransferase